MYLGIGHIDHDLKTPNYYRGVFLSGKIVSGPEYVELELYECHHSMPTRRDETQAVVVGRCSLERLLDHAKSLLSVSEDESQHRSLVCREIGSLRDQCLRSQGGGNSGGVQRSWYWTGLHSCST